MTALGISLIVVALALLVAEAHLSTGGLIGVGASAAAVGGGALLLLSAGAGAAAHVFVDGSLWRAEPSPIHEQAELHEGDQVVVERVSGLTLCVRKAEEWELN